MNFKKSYNFGKKQEALVLPIIRDYFKDNYIRPTEGQYCRFDFTSDLIDFELKSRTNNSIKYPTTMITANKLISEKRIILLFSFTDGLYYIEYDEDIFNTFDRQNFQRSGGEWRESEHIYIPIDYLKLIKEYI